MVELGYNYRLPDVQCALGLAQLARLPDWLAARRQVARWYDDAFAAVPHATPLAVRPDREHAYHLYVVQLAPQIDRDKAFAALRGQGIGANVHYAPVHLMGFYRARGYGPGLAPVAEEAARHILTLPLFPAMAKADVGRVVEAVAALASA
jgi:perosamine synthetase